MRASSIRRSRSTRSSVVDDGSTDSTCAVVRAYGDRVVLLRTIAAALPQRGIEGSSERPATGLPSSTQTTSGRRQSSRSNCSIWIGIRSAASSTPATTSLATMNGSCRRHRLSSVETIEWSTCCSRRAGSACQPPSSVRPVPSRFENGLPPARTSSSLAISWGPVSNSAMSTTRSWGIVSTPSRQTAKRDRRSPGSRPNGVGSWRHSPHSPTSSVRLRNDLLTKVVRAMSQARSSRDWRRYWEWRHWLADHWPSDLPRPGEPRRADLSRRPLRGERPS